MTTSETRYMWNQQATVNGLTAYELMNSIDSSGSSSAGGSSSTCSFQFGIRVFQRNAAGSEIELTAGTPVAIINITSTGSGTLTATWACPVFSLLSTDAIVVRLYLLLSGGSWTLEASFITNQVQNWTGSPSQLCAATWTVQYYYSCVKSKSTYTCYVYWGTSSYLTEIQNFTFGPGPTAYSLTFGDKNGAKDGYWKGASKRFIERAGSHDSGARTKRLFHRVFGDKMGAKDWREKLAKIVLNYTLFTQVGDGTLIIDDSRDLHSNNMYDYYSVYLYLDEGVPPLFSGNYQFDVDVQYTNFTYNACLQPLGYQFLFGLTNTLGTYQAGNPQQAVGIRFSNIGMTIVLCDGSTIQNYAISANTWYYLRIARVMNTLTCQIYSDAARTNLLSTLTISNCSTTPWRYIYAFQNDGNASDTCEGSAKAANLTYYPYVHNAQAYRILVEKFGSKDPQAWWYAGVTAPHCMDGGGDGVLTFPDGVRRIVIVVGYGIRLEGETGPHWGETWGYDPQTNTWTQYDTLTLNQINVNGLWDEGSVAVGNKLYLIGGCCDSGSSDVFNTVYCFDPSQPPGSQWSQLANSNYQHAKMGIAVYNNQIYVFCSSYGIFHQHCEKYNPANNTWTTLSDAPVGCNSVTRIAMNNGFIYFLGQDDNWYMYDPVHDTYTQLAQTENISMSNYTLPVIKGNTFLVISGNLTIPPSPGPIREYKVSATGTTLARRLRTEQIPYAVTYPSMGTFPDINGDLVYAICGRDDATPQANRYQYTQLAHILTEVSPMPVAIARYLSEKLGLKDGWSQSLAPHFIVEKLGLKDTFARARVRLFVVKMGLKDSYGKVKNLRRIFGDKIGSKDIGNVTRRFFHRLFREGAGAKDAGARTLRKFHRVFNEKMGLRDVGNVTRRLFHRVFKEMSGAKDSGARTLRNFHRFFSDKAGFKDSSGRLKRVTKSFSDKLGSLDSYTKSTIIGGIRHYTHVFTERFGFKDAGGVTQRKLHRIFTEKMGFLDTVTFGKVKLVKTCLIIGPISINLATGELEILIS